MSKLSDNIVSNTSYTNKDFNSIYNELLDLVSDLSNKWNPSQSNESDPGVVLLKLSALIGDKIDYNIDKNVLECFPLSVTQQGNARNLYDSLGYKMKWYRSATIGVSDDSNGIGFLVSNTDLFNQLTDAVEYIIPEFTPITNDSGEIVYTTLKEVKLTKNTVENSSANTISPSYTPVIQGTYQDYSVNGNTNITLNNLDADNRLYFTESRIAENGIFIKYSGTGKSWSDSNWVRVDNIESYPSSSTVYSFGVLPNGTTCYIQFPSDIGNLIEGGLNIRYIITNGEDGNIAANTLKNFLNDETVTYKDSQNIIKQATGVVLNDYVTIIQNISTTNGADIETLEQAYRNYKKTIGTFNTLVTRRDYENYLYEAELQETPIVSNLVVADRTTDINTSYYVQQWDSAMLLKTLVQQNNILNAFNIVLYLLNYVENVSTKEAYDETFTPNTEAATKVIVEGLTSEVKSIQHDYKMPTELGLNKIKFNFNNLYKIKATILTYFNISTEEAKDLVTNVKRHLYEKFNTRNIDYGSELQYEDIIDSITEADDRIKGVILNQFTYDTQLLYADGTVAKLADTNSNIDISNEIVAKSVLAGNTQLFNIPQTIQYEFGQSALAGIPAPIQNVIQITPKFTPTLTSTHITLKENESITLVSPAYNTIRQFTYLYYTYNGTEEIPANTLVQLTANITFSGQDANGNLINEVIKSGSYISSTVTITPLTSEKYLSTGQYIYEKELSKTELTRSTEYIFVTSRPESEVISIEPDKPFLLQETDAFIFPNSTKTQLAIWSSGVRLSVPSGGSKVTLTRTSLDLDQINENQIDKISWNALGDNLIGQSLQILSLGQNTEVWLEDTADSLTLTSDLISLQNKGTFCYSSDTTSGSKTYTTEEPWEIASYLALNSTALKNQVLYPNESVEVVNTNDTYTITGDNNGNTCIVFDNSIVLPGGVTYNATDIGVSIVYAYSKGNTPTRVNGVINLTSNETFSFNFTDMSSYNNLYYSWLVPIKIISTNSGTPVKIAGGNNDNNVSISKFDPTQNSYPSDTSISLGSGTYILCVNNSTQLKVTITDGTSDEISVQIGYITKLDGINKEVAYSGLSYEYSLVNNIIGVLEKIKTLTQTVPFNWTYIVPDEDLIQCPVDPESFWNINHIYNKYTIAKIDFDNSSIQVNSSNIS